MGRLKAAIRVQRVCGEVLELSRKRGDCGIWTRGKSIPSDLAMPNFHNSGVFARRASIHHYYDSQIHDESDSWPFTVCIHYAVDRIKIQGTRESAPRTTRIRVSQPPVRTPVYQRPGTPELEQHHFQIVYALRTPRSHRTINSTN